MKKLNKRAQSEIAGFVLIVAIVLIGLMVFLVLSLKKTNEMQNVEAENMLSSILKYTTECSTQPPIMNNIEDLIIECNKNSICINTNEGSCEYLQKILNKMLPDLTRTDQMLSAYQLSISPKIGGNPNILIKSGNCTGTVYMTQKLVKAGVAEDIVLKLSFCYKTSS